MAGSDDNPGFLSLPPELRDRIYDFCFQDRQLKHDRSGSLRFKTVCYNIRASLPHLRLVNRQVKAGYDKGSPLNSTLDISVTEYGPKVGRHQQLPRLPRLAAMSTIVSVDLMFHRHLRLYYEARGYLTMLPYLAPVLPDLAEDLPHIQRLTVSLHFEDETCDWIQEVIRSFENVDTMFKDEKVNEKVNENVDTMLEDKKFNYPQLAKLAQMNAIWSKLDGLENVRLVRWTPGGGVDYDKEALAARLQSCSTHAHCIWYRNMQWEVLE